MTTFELYFCATLLRGALAVLFLLGAESLLRHRLSAGLRRLLWAGCILLLLVPQMNFSALPLKLDLSSLRTAGAAAAPARPSARTAGAGQPGIAPAGERPRSLIRAAWRRFQLHRRNVELGIIAFLPIPALLLLLWRYLRCRRVIRRLPPVTDRRVLDSWRAILMRNGALRTPVVLLDSSRPGLGPTLFGGFRRKLLLPVEALRPLPDKELGLLLEHEYHHSRAGDPLLNLGALFLWALIWYNPFMLIARRRFRSCCELECDRKVLERHPQAVCEYGNLLLRFASAGTQVPAVTLGLAESPRELSRRIRSMTAAVRPRSGKRRFETVAALLIAALLAAPVCLVAVNAKPAARPRPASTATARPMLPHLILKPLLAIPEDDTLMQCWEIVYPENFPAEKSRLAIEIGEAHLEAHLRNRPCFLLLRGRGAVSPEAEIRIEFAASPPSASLPAEEALKGLSAPKLVPAADRRPVYAALFRNGEPVAIHLRVDGIEAEHLSGFRPVSVR